jgi:hypothetical protein
MIDTWAAANLWAALARRRSLVVVAGASSVGKTTLLTALLDFLPANTRRLYLRGCFETFAYMADPTVNPLESALLVNEISPHLPVYLWGPAVGKILQAARRGYQLLATAHADSIHEFVGALTGSPLHIAAPETATFEFVVVLAREEGNQGGRRLRGVWRLQPTRDGVAIDEMPTASPAHNISPETKSGTPEPRIWWGQRELARRQRILEDLRERRIAQLPVTSLLADTGAGDLEA